MPAGPPKSCMTSVRSRRSSASTNCSRLSIWSCSIGPVLRRSTLSEAHVIDREDAMALRPDGICLRNR